MGLLDRCLPGGPPTYKQAPVDGVLGAWTAARTGAGLALAGGQVALTPDALVFSPWDMDETRAWLVKWLGKAGVPHTEDVNELIDRTGLLEPLVLP